MKIQFAKSISNQGGLYVTVALEKKLGHAAEKLDKHLKGLLTRALKENKFKGKLGEFLPLVAPADQKYSRIVLVGIGKDALDEVGLETLGGHICAYASGTLDETANLILEEGDLGKTKVGAGKAAALVANGAVLRSWRFDKYRTKLKPEDKPKLNTIVIQTPAAASAEKHYKPLSAVTEAVFYTRHLVSEPANVIHPESMVEAVKPLSQLGIKVNVLGEKEMQKLGMGALLGVGQGSDKESKLIVLEWMNGPKNQAPVALVGKGVTFDTGGISIKPSDGMEDMIYDMAGSAVVAGTVMALASRKAKVNVVGVMGMVENMCSGTAQRPGDIVKSMSGQTIQVLNTDAEGRLVLADAMWYAHVNYKPSHMIDIATLTGAITVALGYEYAGMFPNDDKLGQHLIAAGKKVEEKLWLMPMDDSYDRLIDSDAADVKNITGQRGGGSITAAKFLQRFVGKDITWAHLDIAGMAWAKKDQPLCRKGATGYGVRLLNQYIHDHFEG